MKIRNKRADEGGRKRGAKRSEKNKRNSELVDRSVQPEARTEERKERLAKGDAMRSSDDSSRREEEFGMAALTIRTKMEDEEDDLKDEKHGKNESESMTKRLKNGKS